MATQTIDYNINVNAGGSLRTIQDIENEWRDLFPFAWADFHRFLKGWSPSHWKINDYSEKITREVVESFR